MISTSDFEKGMIIEYEAQPWIILGYEFLKPGKGGAFMQTKIRNLKSNATREISFKSNERFNELDMERKKAMYIFHNPKEIVFNDVSDKTRFSLPADIIGDQIKYLKSNMTIDIIYVNDEPLNFDIPVKIEYEVKESPGFAKGNTSSGATKTVVMENGLEVDVPMFIKEGDRILVNTEKGTYVERVS